MYSYIHSGAYTFSLPPLPVGEHYVALRLFSGKDDALLSEADTQFVCSDHPPAATSEQAVSTPQGPPRSIPHESGAENQQEIGRVSDEAHAEEELVRRAKVTVTATSPQPCQMLQTDLVVSAQVDVTGSHLG